MSSITHRGFKDQLKFLQGKVLTIIDASISDTEQRKAIKDLINQSFSSQLDNVLLREYDSYCTIQTAETPSDYKPAVTHTSGMDNKTFSNTGKL